MNEIARGDTVKHQPTGETWLVVKVSDGYLYPAGWPKSRALVADCVLVKKGDAATLEWLDKVIALSGGAE